MSTKVTNSRNGVSALKVTEGLRRQIVQGKLIPGEQLPTRSELEVQFGTSPVTVQRALDNLIKDEFVRVNGRRGTFVSDNPPHLSRYAIVFDQHPNSNGWNRFWTAICNAALRVHHPKTCQLFVYTDITPEGTHPNYEKLVREVQAHRLGGLIFPSTVPRRDQRPELYREGLPMVFLGSPDDCSFPSTMNTVYIDMHSFIDRALDEMVANGVKKLAVISHQIKGCSENQYLINQAAVRGLELPSHWFQSVHVEMAQAACQIMELMMSGSEQPDGLLVTDDNLVEQTTLGLVNSRVKVPQKLKVIAHCNYPDVTPSLVPARRVGFNVDNILRTGIATLDEVRSGQHVSLSTSIPALFDTEVNSAS